MAHATSFLPAPAMVSRRDSLTSAFRKKGGQQEVEKGEGGRQDVNIINKDLLH